MSTEGIAEEESCHECICMLPRKTSDGRLQASFVALRVSPAWVCHRCRGLSYTYRSSPSPIWKEFMTSGCIRGGLDWILGKISLLKGL